MPSNVKVASGVLVDVGAVALALIDTVPVEPSTDDEMDVEDDPGNSMSLKVNRPDV